MKNKVNSIAIVAFLVFALMFLRLAYLQIVQGNKYQEMAQDNAAKLILSPAPRGVIYDRYNKVLVENQAVFSVHILPHILLKEPLAKRQKVLAELSRLLEENVELKISASRPVIVKDKISLEKALMVEEKEKQLPGVVVSSRPIRFYPYSSSAAQVLGYVGEVDNSDVINYRLKMGSLIGKAGVERMYDEYLRGIDGGKKIQVDVRGVPLKIVEDVDPVPGANMSLTIDAALQKQAETALGGKAGAVVVMDPNNGEILALVSHPSYDPASFISTVGKNKNINLGYGRFPFLNRALAVYPPGSIFKVITLIAALEENIAKPDELIYCPGYYKLNQRVARCWLAGGHGSISIAEGLVWSCDAVYYEMGRRLGPDRLAKYARQFGLGTKTGIDLPSEKNGTVPDKEWKKTVLKTNWYEGDSINYGIGQGFVQVTPIQMARAYAAIATGRLVKPFIVKEIKNNQNEILYQAKLEISDPLPIPAKTLEIVKNSLREVVKRATGIAARVEGIPAAGKTGTAENPGLAHAWFMCYAPYDKPEIVIASFVEHGLHGDQSSAYVARDILKWYKENRLKTVYPKEEIERQYILHNNHSRDNYR